MTDPVRIFTRSTPFFPRLVGVILAFAVDSAALFPGTDPVASIVVGVAVAMALLLTIPGGPLATTLTTTSTHVSGDFLLYDRAIAFSDVGAVEVVNRLLTKRVRIHARSGEEMIEADLWPSQAWDLLRFLAAHVSHRELAVPRRPRSRYVLDVVSLVGAIAVVVATGWPRRPLGFAIGVLVAVAWTLWGWWHSHALATRMAKTANPGDVPETLRDWYGELARAHERSVGP